MRGGLSVAAIVVISILTVLTVGKVVVQDRKVDESTSGPTNKSKSTNSEETNIPPQKMDMIWSDEFNRYSVDLHKWNVIDKPSKSNNELQYYTSRNVYAYNGSVVLQSKKENMGGKLYTSAELTTERKFSFTYGRIEIRAKLPSGKGILPALWLRPTNGALYPEIDIMEMLGSRPNWVYMTYHYRRPDGTIGKDVGYCVGPDFTAEYHTFTLDWQPGKLTWIVDGQVQFSTTNYITNEPKYITMNTAIGGNWPGNPTSATQFPQEFYVDYVRVWKFRS